MKTKTKITSMLALLLALTVSVSNSTILTKNINGSSSNNASNLSALFKNLEYDSAKPSIRKSYFENLDQLATRIKAENYAVSLRGHADSIGRYKYNWVLSDKRAISVKEYLISKGVKEERIITTPFGSTVPIASNKTAAGRQKNRRVEIELKKINE